MEVLANIWTVPGYLSETVALAAVALIGYLIGHRTRRPSTEEVDERLHAELSRAVRIAKDLHQVAGRLRKEVAQHQTSISQFQSRVNSVQHAEPSEAWQTLTGEAEALLGPTMKLATNLSAAYDQLRQHSAQLMNFAGSRTDPQTGVANRRALEERLDSQLASFEENQSRFSLTLFSVEPPTCSCSEELPSWRLLRSFAETLENSVRETDFVARYSDEEFVVLMAQTTLAGAVVFSERLLRRAAAELGCVVSGGVVEVQAGDTPQKLLSRADSALYSARSNGRNCLYLHNGRSLRELNCSAVEAPELPVAATSDSCVLDYEGWKA
jgi:GGDEF domain-containing protein